MISIDVKPGVMKSKQKIHNAELIVTRDLSIFCGDEFLASVDNSYGLPRRILRGSHLEVADYLSSDKNKSRALGFFYQETVKREAIGTLSDGTKIRVEVDEETEPKSEPIITRGAIFPTESLREPFNKTSNLIEILRNFYTDQYHASYHKAEGRTAKSEKLKRLMLELSEIYNLSYNDVLSRLRQDKERLGFFSQHFFERVFHRADLKENVVGRLHYLKEKAVKGSARDKSEILHDFIADALDCCSLSTVRHLLKNNDNPFILQYGQRYHRFDKTALVYNRSLKEFQPIQEFYNNSRKVTLDVLAEPVSTMSLKAIAVIPQSPSLGLEKFVRAIQ